MFRCDLFSSRLSKCSNLHSELSLSKKYFAISHMLFCKNCAPLKPSTAYATAVTDRDMVTYITLCNCDCCLSRRGGARRSLHAMNRPRSIRPPSILFLLRREDWPPTRYAPWGAESQEWPSFYDCRFGANSSPTRQSNYHNNPPIRPFSALYTTLHLLCMTALMCLSYSN